MHRTLATLSLTLSLLGANAAIAAAQDDSAFTNLPVTRAVLFSSGVGYFEHSGTVRGDAVMRIMFKTEQINDVLKSMVLQDLDGGQVSGVTYDANDPLERALKSFAVDLSHNPNMAQLLDQLRGAAIVVHAPERLEGTVLSVEERKKSIDNNAVITEHVLNIVSLGGIRSLPLQSIDSIQFADEKLQEEMNRALTLIAGARDTEQKPVDIRFTGDGERRVIVGYLVETPVWKTSYRLDLSNDDRPFMQGWAIVENTSNNDWRDVHLSLVSGRPISFIQDLYTPLYMPRPVVRPQLYASLTPQTYKGGIDLAEARPISEAASDADRSVRARRAPAAPPAPQELELRHMSDDAIGLALDGTGVASIADAGAIGELFRFTIAHPVDMARRRSAMLPIVNDGITAEKLSIYNSNVLRDHPLNGVYLTNSTDLKLLTGPVTVFDGGSYAGDAQVDHLSPGEKRLLSYAIDLDVTVDSSNKSDSRISSARIVRGVLQIERSWQYEQTYTIKNKADRNKAIIVEHPFNPVRTLAQPSTFEEKTPELYRFRVDALADATTELTVVENQITHQSIALLNQPISAFQSYMSSSSFRPEVRKALEQAALLKNRHAEAQAKLAQQESRLKQIIDGQHRLRENIKTVGTDSQLGKRYLATLSEEEDQIEQLNKDIAQSRIEVNERRRELENYLNTLDV